MDKDKEFEGECIHADGIIGKAFIEYRDKAELLEKQLQSKDKEIAELKNRVPVKIDYGNNVYHLGGTEKLEDKIAELQAKLDKAEKIIKKIVLSDSEILTLKELLTAKECQYLIELKEDIIKLKEES